MNNELFFDPEAQKNSERSETVEELEDGVIRETLFYPKESSERTAFTGEIIGQPLEDAENWHPQTETNSCAIACQEFVAEQLLEQEFTEREMIDYAKEKGWYEPAEGTTKSDVGKLLEALNLDVERTENLTVRDLMQSIMDGDKVICGVNNFILAKPELADLPGLTANHAVQVIGFDFSDENAPKILLNDPGVVNGKCIRHDLEVFKKAWSTGNNFAAIANVRRAA